MCKDKQNTYQHTPKQLRRKCEGLLKSSLYQKYKEIFPELVSSNEMDISWISQSTSSHILKILFGFEYFRSISDKYLLPVIFFIQETSQINGNDDCRGNISLRQSVNVRYIKIIIPANRWIFRLISKAWSENIKFLLKR